MYVKKHLIELIFVRIEEYFRIWNITAVALLYYALKKIAWQNMTNSSTRPSSHYGLSLSGPHYLLTNMFFLLSDWWIIVSQKTEWTAGRWKSDDF